MKTLRYISRSAYFHCRESKTSSAMTSHEKHSKSPDSVSCHKNPDCAKVKAKANHVDPDHHIMVMKMGTALFYAVSSFFITVVNKSVLTSYKFPSFQFLALSQMITTVVVLFTAKKLGYIKFPNFHFRIFYQIFPLQFIYIGNTVFGLGSTKELSLPMFTMLRRLSIFMTMVGEYLILKVTPSLSVQLSVFLMIFGAAIAALQDLGFNLRGYTFVLLNDLLTASNNIVTKQKLDARSELNKYGLLYYCSLFMLPVLLVIVWQTGDLQKISEYPDWLNPEFVPQYALSCIMGFVLMYSIMICTQFNSALTTTIIGCLKNILVTYLGMFIGGDYVYSLENFIGINISVVGSLLYSWVTFRPTKKAPNSAAKPVTTSV